MNTLYSSGIPIVLLALTAFGFAAAAGEKPKIGDTMPAFTLTDHEGGEHKLSDHTGKILVLECSSHGCPWSRGVDPAIASLAVKYQSMDVVFLGMDSDKGNTPEQIAEHAKSAGIPFPILKDTDNRYADVIGAARTPEIYIVNAEGTLVYHGAFDNRTAPNTEGDTHYVANALEELLAGKEVSTPKVSAWGCTIRRVSPES